MLRRIKNDFTRTLTLTLTTLCLVTVVGTTNAQDKFPEVTASDLQDKTIHFPIQFSEKPTLVAMVFSSKAQDDLNTWLEPVYQQVLDKNGMGSLVYNCNIKLLIALTGAKKSVANKVTKELKKATDKDYLPHVLIYEGDYKTLKEPLRINDKKEAYFFVISKDGTIDAKATGRYTSSKFERLSTHLER